jgi:hypothetical protein
MDQRSLLDMLQQEVAIFILIHTTIQEAVNVSNPINELSLKKLSYYIYVYRATGHTLSSS